MGLKASNEMKNTSESTHQIYSFEPMYTPTEGIYQICHKNCDICNFEFYIFSVFDRLAW